MGALRMILAMAVFSAHAGDLFGLHWISARHCFFALSGFFIQMLLSRPPAPGGARDFWVGRFLRLYPLYALVLAFFLAAVVGRWLADGTLIGAAGRLANSGMPSAYAVLTGVASLTMFGLNIPSSSHIPSGPLWALGAEMSFYLVAPWLLRQSTLLLWAVLVCGLSLMLTRYGNHLPIGTGISFFVVGALSWRGRAWLGRGFERLPRFAWPLVVVAMLYLASHGIGGTATGRAWTQALIAQGFADPFTVGMLVNPVIVALLMPGLLVMTRGNSIDRLVGDLAYPLYLVHGFIVEATQARFGTGPAVTMWTFGACVALAALLLAVDRHVFEPRRNGWHAVALARWQRLRLTAMAPPPVAG